MHFIENGSGDMAVIFLHYFGGAGSSWAGVMAAIAAEVRCIAPDLRGFGLSQKPEAALNVDDYADDVLRFIDTLQLKRYVLAGHSMGGKMALAVAARRPPGLTSVVLVAPSPPTQEPMNDEGRQELLQMFGNAEKIRKHLEALSTQPLPVAVLEREVGNHLQISRNAWEGWVNAGTKEDISDRMERIEVPVAVLGGGADKTFTQTLLQQEVVDRIGPDARLQMIAGAGHLLPLEQAEAVAMSIGAALPVVL